MSLNRFVFDLGRLKAELEDLGRRTPLVLSRSLNRAATAGQGAMVKAIVADTGLQTKYVRRAVTIDKAKRTELVAAVLTEGARLPLIAFGARGPEPSRGRGRGVSYRLKGGRSRIPSGFIATVGAGHRGVFTRVARSRLPIQEAHGPSIPHVFEKFLPTFRSVAEAALVKNLRHEITFAKSKEGAD